MDQIQVKRLERQEWMKYAKNAHLISFSENSQTESFRPDFAFLFVDGRTDTPAGYMTMIEMDADTVYLQHGGVFPDHERTTHVAKAYAKAIKTLSETYETLTTRIENTNYSMLKLALRHGFLITGTFFQHPKLFVELTFEGIP